MTEGGDDMDLSEDPIEGQEEPVGPWFKLTNAKSINRGHSLVDGLNCVDEFNPKLTNSCGPGFYFCRMEDVYEWSKTLGYDHVMDVEIAKGARTVHFKRKSRADRLVLSNLRTIESFYDGLDPQERLSVVKADGLAIQFIKSEDRTLEVRLAAVSQNGHAVQHLTDSERSPLEVRLAAVNQNGHVIKLLSGSERHELQVRFAAVVHSGSAIHHLTRLERQDFHVRLAAVTHNGYALCELSVLERQPLEIRMAAVKQRGDAIRFLNPSERTLEVRLAAIAQEEGAIQHLSASECREIKEHLDMFAESE